MIHVLNFNSQIIDFISRDDNAVTIAKYHKTKDNDLLDIRILSQRAEHFKKRNRIIIQDKNGVYREYIIDRAEEDGRYVDVECTASHLVDISTSKPIPPGKYEKMTINQKLSETLRDSGWVVGDCDYAGLKTNSWTSVRTPLEMISQLETAHEVQADYEIEIDGYEVVERRVNMKIPAPLFKGKEIEYGKDLLSMKRVIDFSEVKTALFALGPEPEQGKRVETFVYDDEAQGQFDLPYRYIWGVYEPETEDDNMSLQRLTTLAKTELNKRKSAAVSYEISVVDIEKEFPHEVIRYGDIVRIKNPDFTPTLYAESEVVGIEHDLISNKCTYEFGKVVEYQEDDLLRYFRNRLGYFNQKFNDKFSNVNTIVRESIEGELQYFERKILKGDTPPENPINDLLWLDTSNPKIPVLRRYFNGEWIKSSAENASDVGAITREKAMYSGLSNTFINLTIQHSRLLKEVSEIVESEYFVDVELKKEVNDKLNATVDVFNHIKTNLDSMNEETATIGKLIDTQALFVDYREKMQSLYNAVENAKIAIDERFKLLQSQYTDEKFNEAMEKVASALPNGHWDSDNKQLTSDVPNEARLKEIEKVLKENVSELDKTLKNYTDSAVLKTRNELSASVRDIDEKVENLQFGGRNLLLGTNDLLKFVRMVGAKGDRSLESSETSRTGNMVKVTNIVRTSSSSVVGFNFKDIAPLFGVDLEEYVLSFYLKTNSEQKVNFLAYNTETISVTPKLISDKFQRVIIRLRPKALKKDVPHHNGNLYLVGENLTDLWIYDIKLEKGLIPTDWTPAPEDTENAINNVSNSLEPIKIRTTKAENSIKVLQDSLLLTATKTDVQRTLDEQLNPLKNEVNEQKAQLQIMSNSIDSKVSQSEYTSNLQGVVERLDNAETHRQQLSNQITDRVTLNDYNSGIDSMKQYADEQVNNLTLGNVNLIKSYKSPEYLKTATVEDGYSLLFSTTGKTINIFFYDANGYINVPLEENTDYILKLHEADENIEMGVFYNKGRNIIKTYTKDRIIRFNTGDKEDFRIILIARDANVHAGKLSLYKGTKELDWTPNPEDVQKNIDNAETNAKQYADTLKQQQDKVLTTYDTRITQNGKDIEQRATKEEYNASKQLLDKTIAQVVTSAVNGVSLSYNDNGTISDLVLNDQGVSLNSSLININQGDVVIENGVTTIKNLSSEKIKVAFNNISTSLSMTGNGLETWENGQMTSLLNGGGHHFYNNTFYVGYIGTSVLTVDSYTRGLSLSLQGAGNFMAFTYSKDKTNPDDASNVAMMWSKGIPGYRQGFFYNEDIVIRDTRVLETAYLRPYGMEPKYRLMFSGRVLEKQEGVGIQYNSVNGSGIHFSNASINIISKTKDGGWQGMNVAGDYITSNAIYNRTYSSASNVYITSYGTLGRSTSASKYKLSQEKQFNDEEQQYNHSKKILNLDIKTWFDKFEAETYAREILTGERQENENFKLKRYAGLIAEDVESVGLKEFVTYGKDKEIEGIEYDRLWIHLIPILKKQNEEIEKLKSEMEVLKYGK
ncbi:phage tail protein [Staphylococcus pseudintermedius]|nr:phage tail protein [Staphylococcus pseudintermedius]